MHKVPLFASLISHEQNAYIHIGHTTVCYKAPINIRVSHTGVTPINVQAQPPLPPLPPPVQAPAANAAAFKAWLDTLFIAKQIAGHLVYDHHGRRAYGLFDRMKCTEANKFINAISQYNWAPAARFSAGILYTASGNEGTLSFYSLSVPPFLG